MQYGTLFILLSNYIPLVLSINSLTFKLNNNLQSTSDHGSEYMSEQTSLQQSTTGVDKHVFSLGEHSPLLITSYRDSLSVFYEYPMENTRSNQFLCAHSDKPCGGSYKISMINKLCSVHVCYGIHNFSLPHNS